MFNQDKWEFINTFAPWLSAIGTISAVILSICLARRDQNIRLEVSANHKLVISQDESEPFSEYLVIRVVNLGHREAELVNIGWKVSFLKKRESIQKVTDSPLSSPLPVRLKGGQEESYYIRLSHENDWLGLLVGNMLSPYPKALSRLLKVRAFTSIGKTFESKLEKKLIEKIAEKADEMKKI